MTQELKAFRAGLAETPPEVEARARRRLEARIAGERARTAPPARRLSARLALPACGAALAGAAVLVAAAVSPSGPTDAPRLRGAAGAQPIASELNARYPGPTRARARTDGLVAALPSLDGRDAGLRPADDRGGWSECATSGCYSVS